MPDSLKMQVRAICCVVESVYGHVLKGITRTRHSCVTSPRRPAPPQAQPSSLAVPCRSAGTTCRGETDVVLPIVG